MDCPDCNPCSLCDQPAPCCNDLEFAELQAEVEKWKKAATDTAFTAERALSRLILAEKVCEAVDNLDKKKLTEAAWGELWGAFEAWEAAKAAN